MKVEIIPFKRDQYDRGSKKIMVDGVEWGTYRMVGHGVHGPTYHAEDHHGPVSERKRTIGSRKGEPVEHSFRPKGRRDRRYDPKTEVLPTDRQLLDEAMRLILVEALRSPADRIAEVQSENEQYRKRREMAEQSESAEFYARALSAIPHQVTTLLHDHLTSQAAIRVCNEMTDAIVAAMRWAQQQ